MCKDGQVAQSKRVDPGYSDSKLPSSYFTPQPKENDTCGVRGGVLNSPSQPWRRFEEQGMRLPTGMHSRTVAPRTGFKSTIAVQNTLPSQTLVSNVGEGLGGT